MGYHDTNNYRGHIIFYRNTLVSHFKEGLAMRDCRWPVVCVCDTMWLCTYYLWGDFTASHDKPRHYYTHSVSTPHSILLTQFPPHTAWALNPTNNQSLASTLIEDLDVTCRLLFALKHCHKSFTNIFGASLSEPHIDEFAVEFLYNWGEPERAPHRRVCC